MKSVIEPDRTASTAEETQPAAQLPEAADPPHDPVPDVRPEESPFSLADPALDRIYLLVGVAVGGGAALLVGALVGWGIIIPVLFYLGIVIGLLGAAARVEELVQHQDEELEGDGLLAPVASRPGGMGLVMFGLALVLVAGSTIVFGLWAMVLAYVFALGALFLWAAAPR